MLRLDETQFRFSNYDGGIISHKLYLGEQCDFVAWLKNQVIVGYINGTELTCRPKKDTYGVLFDLGEDGEYWCHVCKYAFEQFLEEIKE